MIELRSDIDPTGLYPSQVSALQQLQTWWNSTEHEAVIEGFAGTGKTYLVKYFLQHVVNKSYIVTAPTHTALQVLERNTQVKGMTFQKLHGLKPNTELSTFDINNLNFESIGTIKLANSTRKIYVDIAAAKVSDGLYIEHRGEYLNSFELTSK